MADYQDRLHGMHDAILGKEGLVILDEGDNVSSRDIFGAGDDVLVPGESRIEANVGYRPVRDRGAQGDAEEASGKLVVVDILGSAAEFCGTLLATRAHADGNHGASGVPARST